MGNVVNKTPGHASRSDATRQRLRDAAITILINDGLKKFSFVRVCEASGFSRGAIHHHYRAPSDLLADVVADIYSKLLNDGAIDLPPDVTRDDPYSDAVDVVWSHLRSPYFRVLLEIRAAMISDPELSSAVAKPNDEINQSVIAAVAEKYRGQFDLATIRVIFASLTGFALQYFTLTRSSNERAEEYALGFVSMLKGFVAEHRMDAK
jgi:AcrR family transcriptional regulator